MTRGQAEVQHFDAAVGRDEHVCALQIAMDDAVLVRVGQCFRDLQTVANDLIGSDAAFGNHVGQAPAGDELHGNVDRSARLVDVVDRADGRMIQRGRESGLTNETRAGRRIGQHSERQDFERAVAIGQRVAGFCRPRPCRPRQRQSRISYRPVRVPLASCISIYATSSFADSATRTQPGIESPRATIPGPYRMTLGPGVTVGRLRDRGAHRRRRDGRSLPGPRPPSSGATSRSRSCPPAWRTIAIAPCASLVRRKSSPR